MSIRRWDPQPLVERKPSSWNIWMPAETDPSSMCALSSMERQASAISAFAASKLPSPPSAFAALPSCMSVR